jgi:saccharopine dehydrogenase-like NADP-dependent oxidoreductase
MKVIVLGCGLVGGPMAIDLAKETDFDVAVADKNSNALKILKDQHETINTIHRDLGTPGDVSALVSDYDLVLNAVPGFMGFQTLRAIIEAERNVVDIAFFAENPFELDSMAREKGVTAIVDCGVSPGVSNILIGNTHEHLDRTESILIYVGGLPETRRWPFEYKAVFSPIDVIAEYTRPARYVENGQLVVREALSDPELIDFPGIGTLEAFNTDGLRTLAETIDAPNMKEKTLRYPGHIEKMAVLRAAGFFDEEPIEIDGHLIRPVDFTSRLMFPHWKMDEGEVDITVLQVIVEGVKNGCSQRYVYNLLDKYDSPSKTHSMARTTGYTATVAARMVARGLYDQKGISPPEFVGRHQKCVDFMLEGLAERGMVFEVDKVKSKPPLEIAM